MNQEKSDSAPNFAFVALKKLKIPKADKIEAALREFLPAGVEVSDLSIDESAVSFSVEGHPTIFSFMDFPIPWDDLEGPCATSWIWPKATKMMKKHRAHLLVLYTGQNGSRIDQALLLTRLLAAASKAFDAIGVYWGYGCVVLGAEQFQEMAAEASDEDLPLFAWVDFRIQQNPDESFNVLTTGLEFFGCMEIEVIESTASLDDIMDAVGSVATITLQGSVIGDGDTIGPDEDYKIKTRHAKSHWDREGMVLRIEI